MKNYHFCLKPWDISFKTHNLGFCLKIKFHSLVILNLICENPENLEFYTGQSVKVTFHKETGIFQNELDQSH